jgi:hypothetical protein
MGNRRKSKMPKNSFESWDTREGKQRGQSGPQPHKSINCKRKPLSENPVNKV